MSDEEDLLLAMSGFWEFRRENHYRPTFVKDGKAPRLAEVRRMKVRLLTLAVWMTVSTGLVQAAVAADDLNALACYSVTASSAEPNVCATTWHVNGVRPI